MSTNNDYASLVNTVSELPEPFRASIKKEILKEESVRMLVHSPAFKTAATNVPATVLGVTDRRWIAAILDGDGSVAVDECSFADTLLLELTTVLLHGQLKIDFIHGGKPSSTAVQYNTVREKRYREIVDPILEQIETPVSPSAAPTNADIATGVDEWPIKFRNVALTYLPARQKVLAAAYWPAIYGGFNKELSPSTALLVTEREIVIVAEEMSPWWHRRRGRVKYGEIITYFPLSRLAHAHMEARDRTGVLSLAAHAEHGGERLDIVYPRDLENNITQLAERATASFGSNHEDINNL